MSSNNLYFGAAILIALLLFLFIILLRAYRFLFKHCAIFGENVQTRLIALAITSIFLHQESTFFSLNLQEF